jgi:ABC-type Fe3+ transport system substrate-binding protein
MNMIAPVATAPHPAAARLFIAFLMSPEGQEINNKNGFAVLKGIPNTVPLPPLTASDPAEAAAQTAANIQLLGLS